MNEKIQENLDIKNKLRYLEDSFQSLQEDYK